MCAVCVLCVVCVHMCLVHVECVNECDVWHILCACGLCMVGMCVMCVHVCSICRECVCWMVYVCGVTVCTCVWSVWCVHTRNAWNVYVCGLCVVRMCGMCVHVQGVCGLPAEQ